MGGALITPILVGNALTMDVLTMMIVGSILCAVAGKIDIQILSLEEPTRMSVLALVAGQTQIEATNLVSLTLANVVTEEVVCPNIFVRLKMMNVVTTLV